ncbi:MAG: DapH/DapD/GlmU-related protein [Planctomycetota bacterium]
MFKRCGKNVNVESRADFGSGDKVEIGDNSGIGINARIMGRVTIGKDVMMGPEVMVITRNHCFTRTDIPMRAQRYQAEEPVTIGDDVWIGARAILLPGVRLGCGVVVGAGAVVAKEVPDWAIVVGNPARVVGWRNGTHKEDRGTPFE